jgi:hypothetical protein
MLKTFVLVVSLWGYNGTAWVYTGNQMMLQDRFDTLEECEKLGRKFIKYEYNKYLSFRVQCLEDTKKDI